jgi:short-subunit dehydrogenase
MKKKNVVITGANRGIGQQLALRYASPQHHLILIARQSEKLAEVAALCEQKGAEVTQQTFDVRDG